MLVDVPLLLLPRRHVPAVARVVSGHGGVPGGVTVAVVVRGCGPCADGEQVVDGGSKGVVAVSFEGKEVGRCHVGRRCLALVSSFDGCGSELKERHT